MVIRHVRNAALALGIALSSVVVGSAPAMAQVYNAWQPGWNHGMYDRHHVMLGRVLEFHAYRVTIRRRNGNVQTIDLKNGTIIRPLGATPVRGQHIAVIGYYSNGTFIANRIVLR